MNRKGLKILGLGFEAGDSSSGLYALIMIIYFLAFILVVSAVDNMDDPSADIGDDASYSDIRDMINPSSVSYCDYPRYKYNKETLTKDVSIEYNYIDCSEGIGITNPDICDNINGCAWAIKTTNYSFWFWSWQRTTDNESCYGNMNLTPYGIDMRNGTFGGYHVDTWDYSDYENLSGSFNNTLRHLGIAGHEIHGVSSLVDDGRLLCQHPSVLLNQSLCQDLSCSWYTQDTDSGFIGSGKSFLGAAISIFRWNYVFDTGIPSIDTMLYLFFILIPFLLLLVFLFYSVFGARA